MTGPDPAADSAADSAAGSTLSLNLDSMLDARHMTFVLDTRLVVDRKSVV